MGAAVIAVGAGAAATVGLPLVNHSTPVQHTQITSRGDHCYRTYTITDVPQHPDSASVGAARAALANLDIDSLNISDAIKYVTDELSDETWEGPGPRPTFVYATDSVDSREAMALSHAVSVAIASQVSSEGLDPAAFGLRSEGRCDDYKTAITK